MTATCDLPSRPNSRRDRSPMGGARRWPRIGRVAGGRLHSPLRLGVERLAERVMLSAVPYAADPPLVQQARSASERDIGAPLVLEEAADSRLLGIITPNAPKLTKEFRVETTGRLIVDMRAADSALDSMLWLYDDSTGELLVSNDGVACDTSSDTSSDNSCDTLSARISQELTTLDDGQPRVFRLTMAASPDADANQSTGRFALDVSWQPTEKISGSGQRIEGGKEGVVIADLDGDGNEDIASINDDNVLRVFYGVGDGTFRSPDPIVGNIQASASRTIVAGDFDGDGDLDLVIALATDEKLNFVRNLGEGEWALATGSIPLDGRIGAIAVADLDGDGNDDLVVPTRGTNKIVYGDHEKAFEDWSTATLAATDEEKKGLSESEGASIGDFDGDGRLDVVVTFKDGGAALVWLNQMDSDGQTGKLSFLLKDRVPMGPVDAKKIGTQLIVVADFNADGNVDLAAVNDKSDTVSLRFGNGDGTFDKETNRPEFDVGVDSEVVRLGDFNGDGVPDLAVTNEDTHDMSVLIGLKGPDRKATGSFHPRRVYPTGFRPTDLAVGDFNNDGNEDIAVKLDGGELTFLFGRGDGTFLIEEQPTVGDNPEAIAWADFNYDGFADVAVANVGSHDVSVLLGRGDGTFGTQTLYALDDALSPRALVAADVNDDGRVDLVTANQQTDDVSVLLGLGNGRFVLHAATVPVGDSPWAIVADDFDDDGFVDIATANRKGDSVSVLYGAQSGELSFDRQDHGLAGGMSPELLLAGKTGESRYLATVNRLTHDLTVLTFTPSGRELISTEVAASLPDERTFDARNLPGWEWGSSAEPRLDGDTSPTTFLPRSVTTADFNDDGHQDVAMVDDRTHAYFILLGYGDGTFQPPLQFQTLEDPEYIVADYLDEDEHVDLVTAHDGENQIVIHYGRGDGRFEDGKVHDTLDGPERIVLWDLDGDGRRDILVGNNDEKKLSVFLRESDRQFVAKETPLVVADEATAPLLYAGIAVGRFDHDEIPDVASFDRSEDGAIHIVFGNGDGSFRPGKRVEMSDDGDEKASAEFIAAADLDGNGFDDIVVPDMSADRVWILWNDGGQFTNTFHDFRRPKNLGGSADLDIRQAIVADVDADGRLDIAVVDKFLGEVTVIYGDNLRETFENDALAPKVEHLGVGVFPGTLAAANFTAGDDAGLDLVVGNRGSYDLSILKHNAAGGFKAEARIGRTAAPPAAVVADINRDGYEDVVTIRDIDNDLTIDLGAGDGAKSASGGVDGAVVDPIFVDLNADGRDDVVTLTSRGEILVRYREVTSTGDDNSLRYSPPQIVNVDEQGDKIPARDVVVVEAGGAWLIAATDIQDDTSRPAASAGVVSLYRLRSDGRFDRSTVNVGSGAARIAAGNSNGDVRSDLVVFSAFTATVHSLIQNAGGGFDQFDDPLAVGAGVADVALMSVAEGDSAVDLVVTNRSSGMILVFVGNGDGSFTTTPEFAVRAGDQTHWPYGLTGSAVESVHETATVVGGDVDANGAVDLVAINKGTNSAAVILGKGNRSLAGTRPIALTGSPSAVAIGDVDGDENADLVVLYANEGEAAVLLGDGLGGFTPATNEDGNEIRFTVGNAPTGLSLVDVSGDNILDLVVANRFGDVLTLLGDGHGAFSAFRRSSTSILLTVADVDGDGILDQVFTNESQDTIQVKLSSTGAFMQSASDGLDAPGEVVIADFNRDGVTDLAAPNEGANAIVVYLGIAPGKFAAGRSFPVGGNPAHVTVADVNSDGIPDVVAANSGSNDVGVLLGKGRAESWTFGLGPRLAAGQGPVHTAVADATADGVPDIVVTNQRENTVFVLPGRGGGFFDDRSSSVNVFPVGSSPVQSFVSGNTLTAVNRDSNSLTFFPGMNPLVSSTISTFGLRPVSAVVGDFNFDSRLDLLVAHELDGLFSFFAADGDGFTLLRSQHFAGLSHPTDLAVWDDRGRVSVFGVGDGHEAAVLLFSAVPDNGFDVIRTAGEAHTDFSSFGDTFLPFIVSLFSGADLGTLGLLILEGDDGDTLDEESGGSAGDENEVTNQRLPDEWAEELMPEDDEYEDEEAIAGIADSQLAEMQDPAVHEQEELIDADRVAGHDFFFWYLENEPSDEDSDVVGRKSVTPVGQESNDREDARRQDTAPTEASRKVESAGFPQESKLLLDDSRRAPGGTSSERKEEEPLSVPTGEWELPTAQDHSAAAMVLAGMSTGWLSPQVGSPSGRSEELRTRRFRGWAQRVKA